MQEKDAAEARRTWGNKSCDHPEIEKEYYLGAQTGDYVCKQCGQEFSREEYLKLTSEKP